jgi:hypothetical protein
MSFQLNTATALPAEVQLGKEKPQGAFALRSRYALSANSASSWNAGTTLTLPLQTGTPGTFTDVKQGVIQCTLQITNTNPYVDYINFGPSGSMIFFDEMRIYSSGTPVEENLRYSETADLLTIQGGHQCRPFHIYRRNKWRANHGNAGDKHLNFVKPAMVDACGVPMYGRTPFMDKNSGVYCPPSISFGLSNANSPIVNAYYGPADNTNAGGVSFGQMQGNDVTANFNDSASSQSTTVQLTSAHALSAEITSTDFHRNLDFVNGLIATPFKNTQFAIAGASAAQVAVASYLPALRTTPAQWPDYQPSTLCGEFDDDEVEGILGKAKIIEYMKYLCNVRSLPVGVSGSVVTAYNRNCDILAPAAPASANTPGCRFLQYRVSMPFLSGIYGIFAEKMFPDMLIGANNIRIEFKLAQNVKALWTTMDPCRRVPGTLRDFTPFTGTASGVGRIPVQSNGTAVVSVAAMSPANAALGCCNAPLNFVYTSETIGNPNAAEVLQFSIYTEIYNSASALGLDLVMPTAFPGVITGGQTSQLSAGYKASVSNVSNLPKPQYVPTANPWATKEGAVFGAGTQILVPAQVEIATYINEKASCYGTYLPASQAQSRRCWPGTKLEATSDNFGNAGTTSFTIRDIQYIGEQVQLDDVVTSAIIQSAASSEIVVWTRGYRSFEASCDQNTQQNIILPIQIGQAEALYLIFRPSVILNSPDYYSNSFSCPFVGLSYSTLDIPNEPQLKYDVGGSYRLQSSLDSAAMGSFSYQLFSGTKQYPLQPIQTVTELLVEREKSQHNLHNWNMCSTENMGLMAWGTKFGAAATATGLDFDPFMDFGYFTTFVSIYALDDQTITQNPYLQVAEFTDGTADSTALAPGRRIRGRRCPASFANVAGDPYAWQGVLNEFTVPIGTFYLGWDFESWTNHQDVMRTGKFLGQEQLTIRMTGTHLCTASNILALGQVPQTQSIQCTAIVPHVVKMSFVPGGHMLTYY